jgi:hypothetical protein
LRKAIRTLLSSAREAVEPPIMSLLGDCGRLTRGRGRCLEGTW